MLSDVEVSEYLRKVQREYPKIDENVPDLLTNYYARVIAMVKGKIEKADEPLSFLQVLGILKGDIPEGYSDISPFRITAAIISDWSEIQEDENAKMIIEDKSSPQSYDMNALTRAWHLSPYLELSHLALA